MYCKKCLTGRTGDVLGSPCQTPGCSGIIEAEPLFSTLVDELPEPMTCGRRFDMYPGNIPAHEDRGVGQDHWQKFKSNGDRVCSYCGSMHPDDMFKFVRDCIEAGEDTPYGHSVDIEPSDKSYKVYVHRPGVRNAMEGAIKFYTHHLPKDGDGKLVITQQQQDEYKLAVHISKVRFERYMERNYSVKK